MAMTINGQFSQGADNLTTIMNRHQTEMGKSLEKVSTGKKINHAGDDSSGNAISEKMLAQIRGLDQSQENTQSAYSLLKVADAAITSIVDIVRAMKTKALEAANDSL
ncbi:MAG: flagellin, partial [Selenomonadaceae bacterium]|nr:flagellin [Selenomonadaceae bacterium]